VFVSGFFTSYMENVTLSPESFFAVIIIQSAPSTIMPFADINPLPPQEDLSFSSGISPAPAPAKWRSRSCICTHFVSPLIALCPPWGFSPMASSVVESPTEISCPALLQRSIFVVSPWNTGRCIVGGLLVKALRPTDGCPLRRCSALTKLGSNQRNPFCSHPRFCPRLRTIPHPPVPPFCNTLPIFGDESMQPFFFLIKRQRDYSLRAATPNSCCWGHLLVSSVPERPWPDSPFS